MGRAIILSAVFLILTGKCDAQFEQGCSEISLMGSMGSYSVEQNSSGPYSYSHSDSYMYLSFATIYDYYLTTGLSFEPEVSMSWVERSKAVLYLLANVSYTQPVPGSNVAFFGRIGYGVANGVEVPMYLGALFKEMDNLKVGVFNAGMGTKVMVSKSALIRLELNYRSHDWKNDYGHGYGYDNTLKNIGLLTGFSFLF